MMPAMPPRPYILLEANYRQLLDERPNVAVLPWGATEAHNYHLPHGTDVIEAQRIAEAAAERAHARGGKPIVLPAIPFGNNAQQLDQVATISLSTATAAAILDDVAHSLMAQGIDRLVILNAHGGNEFKPLIRDLQPKHGLFVVVAEFWRMLPDLVAELWENPGDHAGQLETSLLLHLCPDLVQMEQAGEGGRVPFKLRHVRQRGVWTPRPWSASHPDTGSGDPKGSTAEAGRRFFDALADTLADLLVELSAARKGDSPYL